MFKTYTVQAVNPMTGECERFRRIFRKRTAEDLADGLRVCGYVVTIYV